jgi:hypothetical protein
VSEPTGSLVPYRVVYSERVRNGIWDHLAELAARGSAQQALDAIKRLDARLRVYPQFGEPLRDLKTPGETLWAGTVPPFVAHYIIDEERRLVFVVSPIKLLPGSG